MRKDLHNKKYSRLSNKADALTPPERISLYDILIPNREYGQGLSTTPLRLEMFQSLQGYTYVKDNNNLTLWT